ncbi:MAG: 23S rRNA (uracil(1939)-C(5))-methyltransferase RlmD [Clostridia bacterium]|nr:23S rRNA (uracil(1939)-C(5))-methyltransferase RlmD [Clostridia bacterium]
MIAIIPIEKNKEYVVNIESISNEGNGVAHIDGFAVFVPNTAAGDVAVIRIVKVKSSYGYGKLIELKKGSPDRTVPICADFKRCGGCQLMHINYDAQLRFKREIVENALKRIGGFQNIVVPSVIGMDIPFRYRNKMVFPVGGNDSYINIGFYAQRSHNIITIQDCKLGNKICDDILSAVKEYMIQTHILPYDEETHSGIIRRIFIRSGHKTGEIMVVISANAQKLPNVVLLIEKLRSISNRIASIILNVNTKRTNLVLGEKSITVWGKDRISDILCNINFNISPNSFFQVNPIQTEKLYAKAIEFADLTGNETVMDIYCGIGTISLYAAKKAKRVIGIEIVEQAIVDAKENAENNGIKNCEFYVGSAESVVPELIKNGVSADVVILDPPRKGSDEKTLSAIAQANPEKIIYISCNSATLARDAKFLAKRGYKIENIVAVDMFPQTVHVECVVLMTREKE